jgi:hypothetical protein
MNSIERVKAALRFKGPDRAPVWKAGVADVLPLAPMPAREWRPGWADNERGRYPYLNGADLVKYRLWRWDAPEWARGPEHRDWFRKPHQEVDEWGVVWDLAAGASSIGHPGPAALTDWGDYEAYIDQYSPRADDPSRYALAARYARVLGRRRYRMAIFAGQGPFTIAHALRGFENFMTDHALHPAPLARLLAHLTRFYLDNARAWVSSGVAPHGFILYDDLAEQTRSFLSPRMFAEFYEPVYRPLIAEVHALGCDFHLHTCGKIDGLIPLLLDWGVDAFELDSPRMTGYPALAPFRGRVMFWGCVNIQSIYALGGPEDCEREVWHMVRNLGTERGGFGAYFYPQPYHIDVPKANIRAFKSGLRKYAAYARIPRGWWDAPAPSGWKDSAVPPLPGGTVGSASGRGSRW